MFRLSSVRSKIILLSVMGIIGMSFIVGVNKYLDYLIKIDIEIGMKGQTIAREILHIMMIEERFINKGNHDLLSQHEKLEKILNRNMTELRSLASDEKIRKLADYIIGIEDDHADIFHSMVRNISKISKDRKAFISGIYSLNQPLKEILDNLNQEEAMLMIEGEVLSHLKREFRKEIKKTEILSYKKLLNIQEVFLFSDVDRYYETKNELKKESELNKDNIRAALAAIYSPELSELWKKAEEHIPEIGKFETSIVLEWEKNRELITQLEEAVAKVQSAALDTTELTRANIEKNKKKTGMISLIVAVGGTVATFLLIWFVSRSISGPVEYLTEVAGKVSDGNLKIRTYVETNDEIKILGTAFNRMLDKIELQVREIMEAAEERERLLDDLSRLTTILEATSDLVAMTTSDVKLIYINSAGRKMVGWRDDENLAAKQISDIYPEWALHVIEKEGIPIAIEKDLWEGEVALLGPDCREISVSQVIMSHKSEEGKLEYLSTIMRDITERLRAEKVESEAKLLAQEMELARTIQTGLLPGSVNNIHPDFEIAASMVTADQVGGDYYDITFDRRGNLWISIGDVSGHGVKPGLIMMMAQTVHATVTASMNCEARDVVVMINGILYRNVHERLNEKKFMTFNALKYLGEGRFEHAGAHLRIIVYRRESGQCELIRTKGVYLNFIKDISKPTKNSYFEMGEGDIMVLYTDGLTEAENPDGEMLDIDGFVKIIGKHVSHDSEAMKENIMADVLKWCDNKKNDDMTLVIVKRKGGRKPFEL